ncbi:putative Forkhead-associated protein [Cupriavidus taiwanensis]|uniref:Forkhead-associated protein n=1 Tax=Cupriavidus taiwanensis TaxID=164546 RepID=A0A375E0Q0_9BURK|nr:FHA domain-containing protein [Cupriavidus taiwanensis]SOZ54685.1 putative Forkhead-associated protein [Cupriavidus taiwanensis]SOZ55406.1 putative Forkhead-associated protein [Cupriavidus taiwanensis]SOZ58021.1 putative Forkhead-associated protein [Cupriavidus taiwanensis]SPA05143.1 putative Forkhead-associated protein [Cupriavidus taiwanensis]
MAPDEALIMEMPVKMAQGSARELAQHEAQDVAQDVAQEFDVLLTPVARPELGEIRIDEALFAVGRSELPFATYPEALAAPLSRRHARIFAEHGAVYVADLGSKNGTRVNGTAVARQPARLSDGDEVAFGPMLSFRVRLSPRAQRPEPPRVALTLVPERHDVGLQPLHVEQFPYLISKGDDAFARFRDSYPHQVNYLSRRHAHLYLKGGIPFVEDLGSTNGTFVNGKRLADHGVPLDDGDLIAFGGNHFVYQAQVRSDGAGDATATRSLLQPPDTPDTPDTPGTPGTPGTPAPPAAVAATIAPPPARDEGDRTTFVGAPDSFLDIFCVDYAAHQEDEVNTEAEAQAAAATAAADGARGGHRARGRAALLLAEGARLFGLEQPARTRRAARWGAALLLLVLVAGAAVYWRGAPERAVQSRFAAGDHAGAAQAADSYLARHPDDVEVQAIGTEALLRAYVPDFAARLKAGDMAGADAELARLRQLGTHNAEARPLVAELDWIGRLERFTAPRGADAPIRLYADEAPMRQLLAYWNQDTAAHQRALGRIAADVPAFRDLYADALSAVRRLQNDASVYLAAIDRLNATIAAELGRDRPEALQPVLAETREKYPRLAGLDRLQSDLDRYTGLLQALRARRLGQLVARLADSRFATPPFQAQLASLGARLPPPEMAREYANAAKAWQRGDSTAALAALGQIRGGPWADDLARDVAHKQKVAAQYAALQSARGGRGYEDRLLDFYAMLEAEEDGYFAKAVEADVNGVRDSALRRARELMASALAAWKQYRANGVIGGEQRLEPGISPKFRAQARLLSQAQDDARQGMRIFTQLRAGESADLAQLAKVEQEIRAEAEQQRHALRELSTVLDPAVLKAKLALIGGEDTGKAPESVAAASAAAATVPPPAPQGKP